MYKSKLAGARKGDGILTALKASEVADARANLPAGTLLSLSP